MPTVLCEILVRCFNQTMNEKLVSSAKKVTKNSTRHDSISISQQYHSAMVTMWRSIEKYIPKRNGCFLWYTANSAATFQIRSAPKIHFHIYCSDAIYTHTRCVHIFISLFLRTFASLHLQSTIWQSVFTQYGKFTPISMLYGPSCARLPACLPICLAVRWT